MEGWSQSSTMNEPSAMRHGAIGHCHLQGHHISNTVVDAALLLGASLTVFAMMGMWASVSCPSERIPAGTCRGCSRSWGPSAHSPTNEAYVGLLLSEGAALFF